MATLCKNCSHALVFDPQSQLLVCSYCGSSFTAEEIESEAKDYRQDLKAEPLSEVYGEKDEKYMDCYVYSCSECGGEIIVNGTEASTTCVYCGNPNVVFNRISRQRCPEYILPFSITKEQAIKLVHEKIGNGIFVPKRIKNFSPDCVRGIYIPYWIVNAEYADALVIRGTTGWGKWSETNHYGRAGSLALKDYPVDACRVLSDKISSKLEPFHLSNMKPFDEDYLAGFYSNVSDVTYSDLRSAVFNKAKELFNEDAMNNVRARKLKITDSCPYPSFLLDNNMKYAMLPVWFITFDHKKKHNTILVNGDTGKIVGGIPFNKKLFYALLFSFGIVVAAAAYFVISYTWVFAPSSPIFLAIGVVALFSTGIRKIVKVMKNIKLTQDKDMFSFTKKRQG